MCVVNSDKSKYEVIVCDNFGSYICTINFSSITNVCRFIDEANLNNCKIDIFRKVDNKNIDIEILMAIWKSDFNESEDK